MGNLIGKTKPKKSAGEKSPLKHLSIDEGFGGAEVFLCKT